MMIVFDYNFVTLNQYIKAERSNKYIASNIKKVSTNACHYIALESKHEPITKKVNIKFVWFKHNNMTDHDNIAFAKKFILDGLVKAGILKNDSPKYVGNLSDDFIFDASKPYTYCAVYFE